MCCGNVFINQTSFRLGVCCLGETCKSSLHILKGGRKFLANCWIWNTVDYTIEFRMLAAQSGWNDVALKAVFKKGLNVKLQAKLACKAVDLSYNEFSTLAIKIDSLIHNSPRSCRLQSASLEQAKSCLDWQRGSVAIFGGLGGIWTGRQILGGLEGCSYCTLQSIASSHCFTKCLFHSVALLLWHIMPALFDQCLVDYRFCLVCQVGLTSSTLQPSDLDSFTEC